MCGAVGFRRETTEAAPGIRKQGPIQQLLTVWTSVTWIVGVGMLTFMLMGAGLTTALLRTIASSLSGTLRCLPLLG